MVARGSVLEGKSWKSGFQPETVCESFLVYLYVSCVQTSTLTKKSDKPSAFSGDLLLVYVKLFLLTQFRLRRSNTMPPILVAYPMGNQLRACRPANQRCFHIFWTYSGQIIVVTIGMTFMSR